MITPRAGLRTAACTVLYLASNLTACIPCHAVVLIEPSIAVTSLLTDNFTLTTDDPVSLAGINVSPGMRLSGESEIWKVTGSAEVSFNRYTESEFDDIEGALGLLAEYRAERDTFGLNLQYVHDNTLVEELATTGVVQPYSPRTEITLNPSWSRALTERSQLAATYSHVRVDYEDTVGTSLIDYDYYIATLRLQHEFSARALGAIAAYYDRFETDPSRFDANTVGVQAEVAYKFSETAAAKLVLGPRLTRSTTAAQTTVCTGPIQGGVCQGEETTLNSEMTADSTGFTGVADFTKLWQTAALRARAARELNPSGSNGLVETDSLRVALTKELTPTVRATLDAGMYRSRNIGAGIDPNKSRYFQVEPHVSWQIAPLWTIDAGYSYARQKYDDDPSSATANKVYVALSYTWRKMTLPK